MKTWPSDLVVPTEVNIALFDRNTELFSALLSAWEENTAVSLEAPFEGQWVVIEKVRKVALPDSAVPGKVLQTSFTLRKVRSVLIN